MKANKIIVITLMLIAIFLLNNSYSQEQGNNNLTPQSKEEAPPEIKQKYEEIKSKISQLGNSIEAIKNLITENQEQLKQTEYMINNLQIEIEDKSTSAEIGEELTKSLNRYKNRKIKLGAQVVLLEIESSPNLEQLNAELAEVLNKKNELESKYLLIQLALVKLPILSETVYGFQGSQLIIKGEYALKKKDDLSINLVVARTRPGYTICKIYINDNLVKSEIFNLVKKDNKEIIIKDFELPYQEGSNKIAIVFKTEEGPTKYPSFFENPLHVFNESLISSRSLITASFDIEKNE